MNHKSLFSQILTSLVLTVYLIGSNSVFLPLIEYAVDYERIVTEKCENISRPELNCNGKCYLVLQITKAENNENDSSNSNPIQIKISIDPHYILTNIHNDIINSTFSLITLHNQPTELYINKIDRPPQC